MPRVGATVAAWLMAFGALVPVFAADTSPSLVGEGRIVTRVVLRSDVEIRQANRAREFILLPEGELLTADGVRQVLLNLQGSGLVSEAEVFTRLDGEGVEVVVAAWSNVIIDSISFEGDFALRVVDLMDLVSLQVRGPLIESRVLRTFNDILDRHEEEGFLEASAIFAVDVDESRKRATVVFDIESGPRAKVGEIEFVGDLGRVTEAELLAAMESRSGERYWPQRVRRDADSLQNLMIGRSYRTARVNRPTETYDYETHRMHLSYEIDAGPIVEVSAVGTDLRTLRREGLLAFMGVQGYDPALVSFSVRRVRTWYQSEGYYRVDVQTEEEVSDERIDLTLTVDRGSRFRLAKVGLEGNEAFEESVLKRLMVTSERRAFTPGSGRLVDEWLLEDLRSLRSYYALQGFGEASVGPGRVEERGDELRLTIPIVEGPRRRVGTMSFRGIDQLSVADLERDLALRADGPFHSTLLDRSVSEVRARYRDAGFENALVASEVDWDAAGGVGDITFGVIEGRRTIVRRVVVRGQQVTSPWLLRRTIDLHPGDPVSRSQLLLIQRRLYGLGVFTSVDVTMARGELLSGERDVVVELQEGDRHRLSLGAGYNTEDGFRGLFGYSLGNLAGRATSLHLDAIVAQREEVFRFLVLQPAMGAWKAPMQYTIFANREEEPSLSDAFEGDFITEEQGAQVEADLRFEKLRLPLLYTYKLVDNNASNELDEILFDREKSRVRISSLTAALQADGRDDSVNPSRGSNSVIQTEYAFPVLGADENFLKVFLQQTKYFDLGSAGIVGASLRLGGIESFRDDPEVPSQTATDCMADEIPDFGVAYSERFFAGGRSTHRAYKLDTLGIPGQTLFANRTEDPTTGICKEKAFTTGGNGLALFNLDYRYPLVYDLWATVFFDSGNVWADWRDIALEDFKDGLGVGVGWDSPIGPLRLEIGWKLDREEFEDPYQVFLSFGTAF